MVAFQNEIILPRQARDQHLGKVEIEKEAFLSSAGGRGLGMGAVSAVLDGIHGVAGPAAPSVWRQRGVRRRPSARWRPAAGCLEGAFLAVFVPSLSLSPCLSL